ncbi:MAG: RDD family protein [Acidobacteria bacterium]|nr:RDD family protein [Acidobacteriota bacterium]
MNCRYCEIANPEGSTRCRKCEAPLDAPPARSSSSRRRATAAALQELPLPVPRPHTAIDEPAIRRPAYQPSLFGGDTSKVVNIRPGAEPRPRARRGGGQPPLPSGAPRYEQRQLALAGSAGAGRRRRSQDGVVSCNAPVAGVMYRVMAFGIDLSLVAIATGTAIAGVALWGDVSLAKGAAALACGAGLFLCWLLYQLLWSLAGADSPGMTWVRLRCLDFNGYRPKVRQRLFRLGVLCLGSLAAGLGLAWALVDEEGLTWQDHVSETFPTPF